MWFCFCKQKTAYEMRISDWSSDVCSSDLWIMLGLADRRIEASSPPRGGDRVPQPDFRPQQGGEPRFVVERLQLSAGDLADQMPEAILRMRVVAPRRDRTSVE